MSSADVQTDADSPTDSVSRILPAHASSDLTEWPAASTLDTGTIEFVRGLSTNKRPGPEDPACISHQPSAIGYFPLAIDPRNSELLLVLPIFESSSSMPSTGDSG